MSDKRTLYFTVEQLIAMHDKFGKPGDEEGIRNYGVLYTVVNTAKAEPDTFKTAAIYLHDISINQPWLDRNRRTAFGATNIFLRMNGYKIPDLKGLLDVPKFMNNVKDGKFSIEELASLLKKHSEKKKSKSYEEALKWYLDKYGKTIDSLSKLS